MTSIGAGLRLPTSRSVPAEFAHGHMTENLVLDPSHISPHTAVFDDDESRPGTRTINICVDHPKFGLMVLGSLTLDNWAEDDGWQGHADGQTGAGSDHDYVGYDKGTERRTEDEYLENSTESIGRAPHELVGPDFDHSLLLNPIWQTDAEAARYVMSLLNDSDHLSTIKAFLYPPDSAAAGDDVVEPRSPSVPPVQLAALRSSDQDNGPDRGQQAHAVSPVSWLQQMGESLNPISTAHAAGPEEDETRGRAGESPDPLREVRVQRYYNLMGRLREVEPGNDLLKTIQTRDYTPTDRDIDEVKEELEQAQRRSDRPEGTPGLSSPLPLPSLSPRSPGDSAYDLALQAQREQAVVDYWRSQGASEAAIRTKVEAFRRDNPGTVESGRSSTSIDRSPAPARVDTFEERLADAIRESRFTGGTLTGIIRGPTRMANSDPDPTLGPNQVRYYVRFANEFGVNSVYSVNYDPATGRFGVIKLSSGPKR